MCSDRQVRCPFCELPPERIFAQTDVAMAIFDRCPITEGHALVVPRRHVASIYELPEPEQAELWCLVGQVRRLLIEKFHPDGFNIGLNEGVAAGRTIISHAHIHAITRRRGDTPDPRGGVRWIIPDKGRGGSE